MAESRTKSDAEDSTIPAPTMRLTRHLGTDGKSAIPLSFTEPTPAQVRVLERIAAVKRALNLGVR